MSKEWTAHGNFLIARSSKNILARLPFFDEQFREYARSQRAKWDGLDKAWVFPLEREAEILLALQKMDAARHEAENAKQNDNAAIAEKMNRKPFNFSGASISVVYDESNQRFIIKFPYNDAISSKIRHVGGRWSPEHKCFTAPPSAYETLLELTEKPREEVRIFEARNRPYANLESEKPLHLSVHDKANPYSISIEADTVEMAYKVAFPFSLKSRLGIEIIGPIFNANHAHVPARADDQEHKLPKFNANSVVFEYCHREKIQKISHEISAALEAFGPSETIVIQAGTLLGRRWSNERLAPEAGEILLQDNQAWLITKANRHQGSATLRGHKLSAEDAKRRLEEMGMTSKKRCADMSGFDFQSLDAYVEALAISESAKLPDLKKAPSKRL